MYDRILVAVDGSRTSMGAGMLWRPAWKSAAVLIEKVAQRISDLVIAQAHEWGADLIVIGSHGRHGLDRAMMGKRREADDASPVDTCSRGS